MVDKVPAVYAAIANVAKAMSEDGVAKNRKNAQQGFSFRGVDDVMNALSPVLASNSLVMLPRVQEWSATEHQTKSGGTSFRVVLKVEYDIVCAVDGSVHTICSYGEAMDSGDKATNKAMSAAYKYACFQAFCIPTEGDNDADAVTHEVKPAKPTAKPAPKAPVGDTWTDERWQAWQLDTCQRIFVCPHPDDLDVLTGEILPRLKIAKTAHPQTHANVVKAGQEKRASFQQGTTQESNAQ